MADALRPFTPAGMPVAYVAAYAIQSAPAAFDSDGGKIVDLGAFNDFPDFNPYNSVGDDQFVSDRDHSEVMLAHCRWIMVDVDDHNDEQDIDAWADHIQDACVRVAKLYDGIRQLKNLTPLLPFDWLDVTCQAVIDNILIGRMQDDIDHLERMIALYRASRTEIEHINEMPCRTCQGEGGELLPCDECGASQGDDDDD